MRKQALENKGKDTSTFKYRQGKEVRLLDGRNKSLAELRSEFAVPLNTPALCKTLKLQETTVSNMRKVARTAGHFGIFSPCGIVRRLELHYLDESASQL